MNGFIGIKTNWYTKVKKTLTCVQAIRLHHIQNIQTENQYSARMKGVKSRVLSFLLNAAILETQTISNGRLFQISIILFAKLTCVWLIHFYPLFLSPSLCVRVCVWLIRINSDQS